MTPPDCLRCGAELSAFTGVTEDAIIPDNGSVSLCLYCGALAMFVVRDGIISLREPTDEERAELMQDQLIIDALSARQIAMDLGGLA